MFKFSFNSIKTRVRLFFIINIALVAVNYLFTDIANNAAQNDRQLVQVSRENEKFIEKLDLITKSIVENGEKDLKTTLDKEINKYSANLEALRNGGEVTIGEKLPKIDAGATKKTSELKGLEDAWKQLRRHLQIIIDKQIQIDTVAIDESQQIDIPEDLTPIKPDTTKKGGKDKEKQNREAKEDSLRKANADKERGQQAVSYYSQTNPEVEQHYYLAKTSRDEVLNKNRELSEMYEEGFENSQKYLRFILFVTFLLNLIVLVGGTFVIGTYFITPLKNISATAKQVADGDITAKVNYKRKDEIGEVADSLNQIVYSFTQYTDFAQEIGKGKFETEFKINSENDTLGDALIGMRNSLKAVAEEDSKRNWANEGFTLFSNLLRITDKNMEEFCYSIISNLVKYLDANQGGFFLLTKDKENNEEYLDLQASFAYNRRKYEQKRLNVGQGLLGQAVMERNMIYLDEIPKDYVQITSGLGKATPRCLLIIPLKVNEEVFGAVEMASFNYFEKHELDFLERMAENIASTLATLRNSENTKQLLEETQSYAKQMQEQEVKMVQSMDELANTKEEMERNQRKLDEYRKNLEREVETRTMEIREKEIRLAQVITQLQGIIDSARAGIVAIDTRYQVVAANQISHEQIVERHQVKFKMGDNWLNIFANEQERLKNKLRWDKALGGNFFIEEEKYINLQGKIQWFEIAYNPIVDDSKNIIGASMFARDITERKRELLNIEISAHALDNSTSEVYLFDAKNYLFTQANERACENLGYTQTELKTFAPYQLLMGYDQARLQEILKPLESRETKDIEFEAVLQRKNGSNYDVWVDLQLFEEAENAVYVAIIHDITQRKRDEQVLKEALARFALATQATKEGIWELHVSPTDPLNPDNTAWWSDRFKELIGLTENDPFPEKLVSWSARIHPDDRADTLRTLYEHLTDRTGKVDFEAEYRLLTTKNEYEWFSASGETQRDADGNPLKMVGSIRNVSRRKKAEAELLEKTTIVNAILNATINSILAIDAEFNVMICNPATAHIFGYTPEEMAGKSILSLLENPTEDLRNYVNKTQNIKGVNKAGEVIPLEITVTSGIVIDKTMYVVVFREAK